MRIEKAIRLFAQDLKLTPKEQALVCAMFSANEVALRGQETLIPVLEALTALGLGGVINSNTLIRLRDHLASIVDAKYMHEMDGRSLSFSAFSSLSINRGTEHIVFTANPNACALIMLLSKRLARDSDNSDD